MHSSFIGNIWGADLADIQLLNKLNKGVRFSWWIMDIYNKYTFVISLKDRKGIKVTNAFQKVLDESNQKTSKIWVDKSSEFYYRSIKLWLEKLA